MPLNLTHRAFNWRSLLAHSDPKVQRGNREEVAASFIYRNAMSARRSISTSRRPSPSPSHLPARLWPTAASPALFLAGRFRDTVFLAAVSIVHGALWPRGPRRREEVGKRREREEGEKRGRVGRRTTGIASRHGLTLSDGAHARTHTRAPLGARRRVLSEVRLHEGGHLKVGGEVAVVV